MLRNTIMAIFEVRIYHLSQWQQDIQGGQNRVEYDKSTLLLKIFRQLMFFNFTIIR